MSSPTFSSTSSASGNSDHPLYKTKFCRNMEQYGKCRYGKRCDFAHSTEELRQLPDRRPRHVRPPTPAPETPRVVTQVSFTDDDFPPLSESASSAAHSASSSDNDDVEDSISTSTRTSTPATESLEFPVFTMNPESPPFVPAYFGVCALVSAQ